MNSAYGEAALESMSQAVWYNQWTLRKFEQYLKKDILEVGCGIGNFTKTLTKFGNVWAIDINREFLKKTKKLARVGLKVGFGDIEKGKYFFKDKKFSSVVCINVLEHIENDKQALKNIHSLLKDESFLILVVPAQMFLYGEIDKSVGHFRRYNRQELENLLIQSGFKIIDRKLLNILGAIGWWVSSVFLRNKKITENKIKLFNLLARLVLPLEDIIEIPFGISIIIIAQK